MKKFKKLIYVVGLMLFALVLVACSSENGGDKKNEATIELNEDYSQLGIKEEVLIANSSEKIELFEYMVKMGFKEIEVGVPSASETEYAILRTLIDGNHIPDDVLKSELFSYLRRAPD